MNILNKLTGRNLLLNKKRSIVTIIGIILSTALICGVAALVTSFQNALIENAKTSHGNWHTIYYNVPKEDQKYIINHEGIKDSMMIKDIGYAKLEGSKNLFKPYVFLKELDDNALKNLPIFLVSGRLPENANEIVISSHMLSDAEVKLKIGDKITLGIGKRFSEGYELKQNNPYVSSRFSEDVKDKDKLVEEDENLVVDFSKEYTIVGIIERPNFENYSAPGYTIISRLDQNNYESADISVLYKNVRDTYPITEKIADVNTKENKLDGKYQYEYNSNLLRFYGISKNNYIDTTIYFVSAIVIIIIVVTSIFVIRNSFSISITERFRQYGMLASVGATSKQIKKNVLYEGFILGMIAIPIGIVSGIFAIYVLLKVVMMILGRYLNNINLVLAISPMAILISIIIAAITIFLSSYLPARKASKISPLEAIRSNNDIKIKGKKLKTSRIFRKAFGIEGEIALKNLKRSKKKYRTTILSIAVSIMIFVSLNTFMNYGFNMSNIYYETYDYNIRVNYSISNNGDALKYYNNILKLDNITNYSIRKEATEEVDMKKFASDMTKEVQNYRYETDGETFINENFMVEFIALGDKNYKEYLHKLGLDEKEFMKKGILLNKGITVKDDRRIIYDYINIKENETLEFHEYNETENLEIVIGKITEEVPFSVNKNNYHPIIIVSDEWIESLHCGVGSLFIQSSNASQLEKDIEKVEGYMRNTVYNIEDAVNEQNAINLVISIFLYGFITVITLIGVTNIFNTITTNMTLRYKEFAVLKSIGMTDKEFRKMINFESIFYGLKSLFYGIPAGCVLSYLIFRAIGVSYQMPYQFPYQAILICIIFVILIVWSTMRYSLKKAEKLNIIDTIRNENI